MLLALEVEVSSGPAEVPAEIRQLIRQMSVANPLWGAPSIGQTSIAKYMARRRGPPSQGWKTFLRNHADGVAVMDLFVVPTVSFRKDAPIWRDTQCAGRIEVRPVLGGLHHQYVRI